MDITSSPNLKPFRVENPWEVINGLFTANVGTLNKGTFVSIVSATGNNNVFYSGNNPATPHLGVVGNWGGAPSYAVSKRWSIRDTVKAADAGEVVLGVTLKDLKETNDFSENFAYRPRYERSEQQVVLSGEAIPIMTRGIISTNGFVGTPVPGSGATVSGGKLVVAAYSNSIGNVGKWIKAADYDGYATFKVEC